MNLPTMSKGVKVALGAVSVGLTTIIVAPLALSSQDLFQWAQSGLGLSTGWAWLVPVSLDMSAVAAIGICIASTLRRERAGVFSLLVWVFALASAYFQYLHGLSIKATAPQAFVFFPAIALLGPLMMELSLHKIRKWLRKDSGESLSGAAGFGARWLPFVALKETAAAWAVSRREGISNAADAVAFVREVKALKGKQGADAIRYAFRQLGTNSAAIAEVWLQARGIEIDQAAIDAATAGIPQFPLPPRAGNPISPAPAGSPQVTVEDMFAQALSEARTNRDRMKIAMAATGTTEQSVIRDWLAARGYSVSRSDLHKVSHLVSKAALTESTGQLPIITGGSSTTTE